MNNSKIVGTYKCIRNESFSGMITGTVTIVSGIEFINNGMLCKNVIVEEEGKFINHGMVSGNIMGNGYFEIWGIVNGDISSNMKGIIYKNSIVNGIKYTEDCEVK